MTDYSAFPRIEGLVDLACRNGVDVRPTLLRVLTDLYVQAPSHTPDEEAQYKELALRLIDNVDAPTRNAIAGRLAGYPRAPLAIVRRLKELGATVPAAPAAPPAPHVKLREDFFAADSYERQLMLTNLDAAGASLVAPPAAVETCKRIEAAVLAGNIGDFIGLIESALTLPRAIAEKVAYDNGGEPLVIVARALGMPRTVLERVLLLLNPAIGQSVERVYGLAALYDEITAATAESMLAIWRGTAPRRGAYQPALHDDEKRSARTTMTTTARHQTHRRSDALAARFRNSGR